MTNVQALVARECPMKKDASAANLHAQHGVVFSVLELTIGWSLFLGNWSFCHL